MEFAQAIVARHSVRSFKDKEVPTATLKEIVQLAQNAPSWGNSQSWKVYIATGNKAVKIRQRFFDLSKKGVPGNSDFPVAHRTDWSAFAQDNMSTHHNRLISYLGDDYHTYDESQDLVFNAPDLVYLTIGQNYTPWSVYDLGAFGQSLMLAAQDQGVDSMPAYGIVKYPAVVREELAVPDDEVIAMGIALGYESTAKVNSFRSKRRPIDDVLTIN